MSPKYKKAIRDRIPDIIRASRKDCTITSLDDEAFLVAIEAKLTEEVQEYLQSKHVEELADILEVVYRIAELRGTDAQALNQMREQKAEKRGKFQKNLYLEETI